VCLQSYHYPYRMFSVPTECSECLQDDQVSYRAFRVPTDCSVPVRLFRVPTECLAFLEDSKYSYRYLVCIQCVQYPNGVFSFPKVFSMHKG
jgi:hypothetical protein